MPDVLIYGDSICNPELRHEVPVPITDGFLYVEKGKRRVVVLHPFETPPPPEEAPALGVAPPEQLNADELFSQELQGWEIQNELVLRGCRELGIEHATVPDTFPLGLADNLRANGIELVVDRDLFDDRRRAKNETELRGIRKAQKACEAALDASRELLRRARPNGAGLELDGRPLTSERLKRVIEDVFADHEVEGSDMIVAHGPQTAVGHNMGSGQIGPNEPIVFDLFPKDRATGCYSDMTRTYVVGEPSEEVAEWHALVKRAL